ncbi:hypothetical protein M3Y99_01043000 [Aphelenchoides fujianensis]|nr:hypothetical protein M3Y99_01043000 [Aphelenchoides fujianensis]
MKYAVVALCLLAAVSYAADPKAAVASKFTKQVTAFLTADQVEDVADAAMKKIVVFASTSDIAGAAINEAMASLQGGQYIQGMNLINKGMKAFGNMSAINETIQLCISGASPVVMPLYKTLWNDKLQPQKDAGAAKLSSIAYTFINSKFKPKLLKKVGKACFSKLSKDQQTKAKSVLNGVVFFSKLGI